MERRSKVLIVVVAGVFMAGLDVFIVNIAFSQCRPTFPDKSQITVVGAELLRDRLRRVPDRRRALVEHFGRKRSYLLGTGLFVSASAAWRGAVDPFLVAARAVQGLGAAPDAGLARAAAAGIPPEQRHIPIGSGPRSAESPPPPDRHSAASWFKPAGAGVHRQLACRLANLISAAACCARFAVPTQSGPTSSAPACSPRGWRRSRGDHPGSTWGWASPRPGACSRSRRC